MGKQLDFRRSQPANVMESRFGQASRARLERIKTRPGVRSRPLKELYADVESCDGRRVPAVAEASGTVMMGPVP